MDILVCIKRIPLTSESTDFVQIDASEKDIKRERLSFRINDWDEYALEEAVQIKNKLGGTVSAITVGLEDCDDILRRALAMGADKAIRINEDLSGADSYVVAKVLTSLIKRLPHRLVMFGMQSGDFGSAQLGVMVAEMLRIPHAAGVIRLKPQDREIEVSRELEAGALEAYTIQLPALLTIQTGINKPRYLSFAHIRAARAKDIKVVGLDELDLDRDALTPLTRLEKLELPSAGKVQIIPGPVKEAASQLVTLLKSRGTL